MTEFDGHGGQLNRAVKVFGIAREQWLDLSTGINPTPYRLPQVPVQIWRRLPEQDDGLDQIAAAYYASENLLLTPGSQWSIENLPTLLKATQEMQVLLPTLGYFEHRLGWQRAGAQLIDYTGFPTAEQIAAADVCVLINPSNPSGQFYAVEKVIALWRQLQRKGGCLIVDEAFIDARQVGSGAASVAPLAGERGLIVLRSLGKFFGLAGARVGALLAWPELLESARMRLQPWALANPSRWAGSQALADINWQRTMAQQLDAQAERLRTLLSVYWPDVGGCELFAFVSCKNSSLWFEKIARQGILIRAFESGLRFGLPASESQWQRLELSLRQLGINHDPN